MAIVDDLHQVAALISAVDEVGHRITHLWSPMKDLNSNQIALAATPEIAVHKPARLHEPARLPDAARGRTNLGDGSMNDPAVRSECDRSRRPDLSNAEPARAGPVKQGRRHPRQRLVLSNRARWQYPSAWGKHNPSCTSNACRVSKLLVASSRSFGNARWRRSNKRLVVASSS